jgi:hypothetical protein
LSSLSIISPKGRDNKKQNILFKGDDDISNNKIKLSRKELEKHLQEQLNFIIKFADAYDKGYEDESLFKLVYLIYKDISKKWKKSIPHWTEIISQFAIIFKDRLEPYLMRPALMNGRMEIEEMNGINLANF